VLPWLDNVAEEDSTMASIQKYVAPGVYDPPGYSQAVKITGAQTILYLAGQVAYDKDGGVAHRGDFKGQARAVFGAIKALVEAGGGKLENIVKLNTYVTDVGNRPDYRAVRDEFFGAKGPASTLVEVSALAHPDYLIEVEAVAFV
jgi:enamine deaminase RidA (YjgF/YER057c/UK114 family)